MNIQDYMPLIAPLQVGENLNMDKDQWAVFNPPTDFSFRDWKDGEQEQIRATIEVCEKELGVQVMLQFERTAFAFQFRLVIFSTRFENGNTHINGWPEILPAMIEQAKQLLKPAPNDSE